MSHPEKNESYFMQRCLELAKESVKNGETPFSSLIVKDGEIVAESGNGVVKHRDVTNHAEILVMREVQRLTNSITLDDYEIYSICEPCPMCSFIIRELHFKKVVFALSSHNMGGYTKWPILQDKDLAKLPVFSEPPEVVMSVLEDEAMELFVSANFHHMFSDLNTVTGKIKRE